MEWLKVLALSSSPSTAKKRKEKKSPAVRHRHQQSSQISGWHCCLFFPPDFSINNMTVFLVPEGVSMTARDVLTFKYLGSDYQHKKHFFKRKKNKHTERMVITK
jgi:hypothetical protein